MEDELAPLIAERTGRDIALLALSDFSVILTHGNGHNYLTIKTRCGYHIPIKFKSQ
jgi:hypothetical protein